MTPGRLWWQLSREAKRGWKAAWHDYFTSQQIFGWRNPLKQPEESVPVHVLCGAEQSTLLLWMLVSWHHFTQRNWRLVIHDDGSLKPEHYERIKTLFPSATMVGPAEADERVFSALRDFPECTAYRKAHPLARKIFDVPLLTPSPRYLLLDSDVLFFRRPEEILAWVDDASREESWFNQEAKDPSPVPLAEMEPVLGFPIWPGVNSGLGLIDRSIVDFSFCDEAITRFDLLSRNLWRVEQLLYALCASRAGRGGLLSRENYEVSLQRDRTPDAISRHYVGAVRDRFFAEGVAGLKDTLRQKAPAR